MKEDAGVRNKLATSQFISGVAGRPGGLGLADTRAGTPDPLALLSVCLAVALLLFKQKNTAGEKPPCSCDCPRHTHSVWFREGKRWVLLSVLGPVS